MFDLAKKEMGAGILKLFLLLFRILKKFKIRNSNCCKKV
jgi:hypothetical protein